MNQIENKEQSDYRNVFQEDVASEYAYVTTQSAYAKAIWEMEKNILDTIFALEKDRKTGIKYLDFACGTGRIITHLEDQVTDAVGVDISEHMLAFARKKVRHARLFHVDITRDEIPEKGPFDIITAFRFFPRAQAQLRSEVLSALRGMLADDGVLVFNNHLRSESLGHRFRTGVVDRIKGVIDREGMSDAEVEAMLEEGAFHKKSEYSFGAIPSAHNWLPMPESLYFRFENSLLNSWISRRLCQQKIYVCKKY